MPTIPRTEIVALHGRIGQTVRVSGLVERVRDQKRRQFLVLRDGRHAVQAVHERGEGVGLAQAVSGLTVGSAVTLIGEVVEAPEVKRGGIEVRLAGLETHSLAQAPLPIAVESGVDKQMDWRSVSLRRPDQRLVFEVQTALEHAMRDFWIIHGFVEIHSPKLMGTASESGAEVFKVGYFGQTAYLAQSPQFYKQMAIAGGLPRVFEIGPVFRAEPSFTTRHETEFTSIDMELAWIDGHHDLMDLEEAWLVHALSAVKARHGEAILETFGVELVVPQRPFPRIPLLEARAICERSGHVPGPAGDLDPEGERRLAAYALERFGSALVFVVDYPTDRRAFYHMRHEDRPGLTKGFDLLWKGIEITTGAQREHRHERLVAQAKEKGFALGPLTHYLDFFRYGCPPHGGMGVGLGRLLMVMLDRPSLREVTLLSRTPNRLSP